MDDLNLKESEAPLRGVRPLVRGLLILFWGIPAALVVCVQTVRLDLWLSLGIAPPLLATAALAAGVFQLAAFQLRDRQWLRAVRRAQAAAVTLCGLSPFLYWWRMAPHHPHFIAMAMALGPVGLWFLDSVNCALRRLGSMLHDEKLELETRWLTGVIRSALGVFAAALLLLAGLRFAPIAPRAMAAAGDYLASVEAVLLLLFLFPLALTMVVIWKLKEATLRRALPEG
ncbi:MAG: hypothetical protein J7M29_03405 [Verrucomicrobia bacterium]|nr:hypothetical protein [Verrucomicrobiota bacterium]